ncbi:uncharacterized protein LOC143236149 [Tachypleus tridentatus]|uniref:uncharacterized protein LOC143236149 n=1 Tax=Tachypleus tridentatus TaxID=6853 RepID=UPI003FCFF828
MDETIISSLSESVSSKKTRTTSDNRLGMSVLTTAVFVAGEMAGSGVLALPESVVGTGWIGLVLIVFCCVNAGFCGIILGRCWTILEERWEEYEGKVRYPYPAIGLRASGRLMRWA